MFQQGSHRLLPEVSSLNPHSCERIGAVRGQKAECGIQVFILTSLQARTHLPPMLPF